MLFIQPLQSRQEQTKWLFKPLVVIKDNLNNDVYDAKRHDGVSSAPPPFMLVTQDPALEAHKCQLLVTVVVQWEQLWKTYSYRAGSPTCIQFTHASSLAREVFISQ